MKKIFVLIAIIISATLLYSQSPTNEDFDSSSSMPYSETIWNNYALGNHINENNYGNNNNITAASRSEVSIILILNDDSVCPGEEIIVTPIFGQGSGGPYTIYYSDGTLITPPIVLHPDTSFELVVFVSDGSGAINSDTAQIHVFPLPNNDFTFNKKSICQNESVQFSEINPVVEGTEYIWDFGDDNNLSYGKYPNHTYNMHGSFTVSLKVISPEGCIKKSKQDDAINVYETPVAEFQAYPPVASIVNPTIDFFNSSSVTDSCIWTFSDGDSLFNIHPSHTFRDVGIFKVELTIGNNWGCKDTYSSNIIIEAEQTFYAPTAFTPDYDEVNDVFKITTLDINKEDFSMIIYDRWGNQVFSTTNISRGWSGINSSGDVHMAGRYTYFAKYKNLKGEDVSKIGTFQLLR